MDFTLSEEQLAVRDLARQIFSDLATVERIKEIESTDERIDRELWQALASAGLLAIAIPEQYGGSGFGIVELALVIMEQGRRVAPVPLWPSLILGALTISRHGTKAQQSRWFPGVASGDVILSAALSESGEDDPLRSSIVATPTKEGWRLNGTKPAVESAHVASAVIVPARLADGQIKVFVVELPARGLDTQHMISTNRQVISTLTFSDVAVTPEDQLGVDTDGCAVLRDVVEHALVGLAAMQVGIAEEATRIAAEYTSNRRQFDKPLSTFQGVSHKAADAYIASQAMYVTMLAAAWRLSAGLDATSEVMVAKMWAADGGHEVIHKTQHIHGGMGADVDYPSHRYFLWGKTIENTMGGSGAWAAQLGRVLATRATS